MKLTSTTIVQCLIISLVYGRVAHPHFPLHALRDAGIENTNSSPAPAPAPAPAPPSVQLLPATNAPIQNNMAPPAPQPPNTIDSQTIPAPPAPPAPVQAPGPVQAPAPVQAPGPVQAQAPAPVAPLALPGPVNRPAGTIDPSLIPVGASLNMLPPEFVNWLITASQIRPPGDSINPANFLQAPASNSPGNPQLFPLLPAGVTPGTPGVPTANVPANPVDMLHGALSQANPTNGAQQNISNPTPVNADAPTATYNGDNNNPAHTDNNNNNNNNNGQVDGNDTGSGNDKSKDSSSSTSRNKSGGTQTTSGSSKLSPRDMTVALVLLGVLSQLV